MNGKKILSALNYIIVGAILILALALLFVVLKTSDNSILGGKKDENGCIPSAGYTWSKSRNECVKVWEEAVSLFKTGSTDPDDLKAFLIFAGDNSTIDVFMPYREDTFLIQQEDKSTWISEDKIYTLVDKEDKITLYKNGQEIYYIHKIKDKKK